MANPVCETEPKDGSPASSHDRRMPIGVVAFLAILGLVESAWIVFLVWGTWKFVNLVV
jgi:hypothetical protein